jgi:hypothetical protein
VTAGIASYPALLDALHAEAAPGRFVAASSGCVLASTDALGVAVPQHLARFGLTCVKAPPTSARDETTADRFAEGLLALHQTVLREVLRHTTARLGERTSENASLLTRPEIQADLAEVAMELQEAAAEPGEQSSASLRWTRHLRLVKSGRVLLRLLGGYSMLTEGPGTDLYLTEVAGNVYLSCLPACSEGRVRPESDGDDD